MRLLRLNPSCPEMQSNDTFEANEVITLVRIHMSTVLTNEFPHLCVCSTCVSAIFKKCGTAASSPASGPSPTLAARPSSPFLAPCRRFIQRSGLHPSLFTRRRTWVDYSNVWICIIFFRWVKLECSAVVLQDWPKMWRKLASRWTRGIRPISYITMKTSNLFTERTKLAMFMC